jgi:hypothetical protein
MAAARCVCVVCREQISRPYDDAIACAACGRALHAACATLVGEESEACCTDCATPSDALDHEMEELVEFARDLSRDLIANPPNEAAFAAAEGRAGFARLREGLAKCSLAELLVAGIAVTEYRKWNKNKEKES